MRLGTIDFVVVRENTEGEYSTVGARIAGGTGDEEVHQTAVFTRRGCDRIMRYVRAARRRGKHRYLGDEIEWDHSLDAILG